MGRKVSDCFNVIRGDDNGNVRNALSSQTTADQFWLG